MHLTTNRPVEMQETVPVFTIVQPTAQGTPLTRGIFPAARLALLPTEISCLTVPFPNPRAGVGASASTKGNAQHDVYADYVSSSDDDDPEVANLKKEMRRFTGRGPPNPPPTVYGDHYHNRHRHNHLQVKMCQERIVPPLRRRPYQAQQCKEKEILV
ncbi:hypothetical protein BJV74DRAFT_857713, partial [Russula compacta]